MNNKPTYNPNIHHRRSIRLKGYDYSQAGLYFITICCQDRACLFGEIVGADLRVCPNADLCVCPNADLCVCPNADLCVCPNADLCVCPNTDLCVCPNGNTHAGNTEGEHVGSPLRVCPNTNAEMQLNDAGKMIEKWYFELENKFPDIKCHEMIVMPNHFHCIVENVGADLRVCPDTNNDNTTPIEGEHVGSPLHRVIQWFKTMTTNEYIRGVKTLGWTPFNGKLWQRNYYEHIIRNEQSYQTISRYIINNPAKWANDKFYMQ
jgi:REP element-mobilizing transposase RayT